MLALLKWLGLALTPVHGGDAGLAWAALAPTVPRQSKGAAASTALIMLRILRAPQNRTQHGCRSRRCLCERVVTFFCPQAARTIVRIVSIYPPARPRSGRRSSGHPCPGSILYGPLGGRPMAGHQVLVLRIGVRIPAPQLGAGRRRRGRAGRPRVPHELCGRPMVLWPVTAALAAGAGRIVVVDTPQRELEPVLPEGVELAVQERPDGTGGALAAAMGAGLDPDAPVVVLSGDVPLIDGQAIRDLVDARRSSRAAATLMSTVLEDPSGYGRILRDRSGALQRVVETKQQGDSTEQEREISEVNVGIYAFDGRALAEVLPGLSTDNAQGELYLPQVFDLLRAAGYAIAAHPVDDPGPALGVNDRVALAQVRTLAQEAIHERHMRAGVSIVDPAATVIDVDVQIGADTVIEPFTTIKGSTRIGEGCLVRHSYLVDCVLEDGASVGPFSYLRPGTVLRRGAQAGAVGGV